MNGLRLGIMSFAHHHAEGYTTLLRRLDHVTLVGFADDDTERASAVARDLDLTMFSSYEELLGQRLDAVLVCSENARHREHVEMAARAGVHVLCEKPLSTTVADANAMVELCRANDVILMTAFPMRFSEPIQQVKGLIASGQLGDVRGIEGVNQGQVPLAHRDWFADPSLAGGGAITDHTVHLFDVFRWLLCDEAVEVYAQSNRLVGGSEIQVETSGLVVLTFSRGTIATIDCSWNRPRTFPTWGGLGVKLVATNGVVDVDAFAQRFASYDDDSGGVSWIDWGADANLAMLKEFLSAVRGNAAMTWGRLDGLRAAEVVEAAYQSVRTGQRVVLR